MIKKIIVCLLLLLTATSTLTLAQETEQQHTVALTLKDAVANEEIESVLMHVTIRNKDKDEERTISSFIKSSSFNLKLAEGNYELKVLVDDLKTPGKDYYALHNVVLQENTREDVALLPVGSIRGTVLDKLDNLVRKASLKITCGKEYGEQAPLTTDRFGSFTSHYLPVGECQITATFRSAVGSKTITIEQGKAKDLTIKLNKSAIGEEDNLLLYLFGIAIPLIILYFGARRWFKRKQPIIKQTKEEKPTEKPIEKPSKEEKQGLSKRQEDLLNTVNEREKKVIKHILAHNNQSTQAKIRYETGIPKTSLVRIFTSLEQKRILHIEKIGKLKKIKLTDWFLGKE